MRIYKAFLINEFIMLKRNWFYLPLFFLFPIVFIVATYANQFKTVGSHYSPEMAGIMAFVGMISGMLLFSGTFTANAISFEKTNNINFFLFSRNINKLHYLLAKLTMPLVLACISIVIPAIIYHKMNLFTTIISPVYTIAFTLFFPIIWTLVFVLFSQLFNRVGDIALASFAGIALILAGVIFIAKPWEYTIWVALIVLCILTAVLFTIVYIVLCKRETKIELEKGHN